MKFFASKTVVALAALTSLSAMAQTAATVAAPNVTIYGRLDLSLTSVNDGAAVSSNKVNDYSSRLGFRGERKFGTDLSGFFQLETTMQADTPAPNAANRNSFVGLKSESLGSLLLGNFDMPLKTLDGTTSQLWAEGDAMETIIHGRGTSAGTGTGGTGTSFNVHTRRTNNIHYTSPKFANTVVKLAYSPEESPVQQAGAVPSYGRPMMGISALYNDGMFNVGLGYQSLDNATAPTAALSGYALTSTKLVAGMKSGDWTAGVAYSVIDNNNSSTATSARKTDNYMVSVAYVMDKITLKANYGVSSESRSNAKDGLTMTAVQADYALDKATTVYTYYSLINNDTNAKAGFTQPSTAIPAAANGAQVSALGVGLRYNF